MSDTQERLAEIRRSENQAGYHQSISTRETVLWLCDQLEAALLTISIEPAKEKRQPRAKEKPAQPQAAA